VYSALCKAEVGEPASCHHVTLILAAVPICFVGLFFFSMLSRNLHKFVFIGFKVR
jgi:hypothetical protein